MTKRRKREHHTHTRHETIRIKQEITHWDQTKARELHTETINRHEDMADERIEHVASYTGNKYHNQSFLFFLNTEFEPIQGSCEESGNTIGTHYFLIYRVKQMNLRLTFRKTASDFFFFIWRCRLPLAHLKLWWHFKANHEKIACMAIF